VAREHDLDWHTVKELDKRYMEEQLKAAGPANPRVIGVDEISVGKGHKYRIVVSDLDKKRAILFGGKDRSEASMDEFHAFLGAKKSEDLQMGVMDMWKAFSQSMQRHVSQSVILYDKFHILRHLGEALDQVRKQEYRRLNGNKRKYIKGQKYNLLSHWENLKSDTKTALKHLLAANKRLQTAYFLKESFAQHWDYKREVWVRKFFENWKSQLKWQRLKPYEKFAKLIERHWEGIGAYCESDKKPALGFVEGFNNKICVIQRRAYGLRDEDYLRLKVLTYMLPEL